LEDVFLKVSELNIHHEDMKHINFFAEDNDDEKEAGRFSHLFAMLQKRWRFFKRDTFGIACEIILPIVCIIAGLAMQELIKILVQNQPALNFSPSNLLGKNFNDQPT